MYATIDIETTGLSRYENDITYVGIGLSNSLEEDLYKVSIFKFPENIPLLKTMLKFLKENKIKTVFQNGKFDTLFLQQKGFPMLPISHDVMLMGTAYDLTSEHGLKAMAQKYLGVPDWDINKKAKTSQSKETEAYLEKDILYTYKLFQYFSKRLDKEQTKVYKSLLLPVYKMFREVEKTGVYIDLKGLEKVKKLYKRKETDALLIMENHAPINWNSPKQVQNLLFNNNSFPTIKLSQRTGEPSADAKVLKRLASQGYKIAQDLLDYKFYYGANTKFLNSWGDYAKHDGRIHPSFNITNVITGRTSCANPNLQQVPRNPELRNLFTAPKGKVFIEADYSQIELRIASHCANEETMLQIYKNNGDIHTATAKAVTGKEEVTKEDRTKAKAVNFGFLYGMQAKKFGEYAFDAYGTTITREEAETYRQRFFEQYPRLLDWYKEQEFMCEGQGGVYNLFGRFIPLPNIYSSDMYEKSKAIRKAINAPVQGTASDLLLLSAVEISQIPDIKIVGTVHDSILLEVEESILECAKNAIKRIMENPSALKDFNIDLKVPLEVDIGVGAWGAK